MVLVKLFWANRLFAHWSWVTWANCSRWLICNERPERFAHGHSFDMSNLSDSLTFAHLIWAIWANRSQSLIWFERWANEQIPSPAIQRHTWHFYYIFGNKLRNGTAFIYYLIPIGQCNSTKQLFFVASVTDEIHGEISSNCRGENPPIVLC